MHYADGTACYSMACTTKHGAMATCPSRCPLCQVCTGPAAPGTECGACVATLAAMARWGPAERAVRNVMAEGPGRDA